MNICDYTTVSAFRRMYQGSAQSAQDSLILHFIKAVTSDIELQGRRWYYPRIQTRYYDKPDSRVLTLRESDLLEPTTVTNGDGSIVTPAQYDLLPYNYSPYYAIRLKLTSGLVWLLDLQGSYEKAVTVDGVWGYSKDYASAWEDSGGTVQNNPLTAGGTSLTIQTNTLTAGDLIKLGAVNDYAYVSAVSSGSAADTATIIRSVNGSTGAAHAQGEAVYIWNPGNDLVNLCMEAVQAHLRLKDNPMGETVVIPGVGRFSTPKDITQWIAGQLTELGYAVVY